MNKVIQGTQAAIQSDIAKIHKADNYQNVTLDLITNMTEEERKKHFVDMPPVWEDETDKLLGLRILPMVKVPRNAHYLRKFIDGKWDPKLSRDWSEPVVRINHPIFMEISEFWSVVALCPPALVGGPAYQGWMAMAGHVPGMLIFPSSQFVAIAKTLVEEPQKEPSAELEEQTQPLDEAPTEEAEQEIKFLFGAWVPFPKVLVEFVDPGMKAFKKSALISELSGLDPLNVNFARFDFSTTEEEPAPFQILEDR